MRKVSLDTITLVIGIIAIAVLVSIYDLNGTITDISHLKIYYFLFAFGAFLAYTWLKFLPWTYIIRKLKLKISISQSTVMMYAFFGMGIIPSSVAQYIPLRHLSNFKKNAQFFSLSIILALGATSGLALLFMTTIAAIFVSKYITYLIALLAATYLLTSLIGMRRTQNLLLTFVNKILNPKKHKLFRFAVKYIEGLKKHSAFLTQKDILSETMLFLPSLFFEAVMLFFILLAFNQNLSIVAVLFIFGVAVELGNISFLPGGLGVTDTSLVSLLLVFGTPGAVAITATVLFRFFNMLLVFVVSYISIFYMRVRFPNTVVKR